jgi:hypothetical protein
MLVVHANYSDGALQLWAESAERTRAAGVNDENARTTVAGSGEGGSGASDERAPHPAAVGVDELRVLLSAAGLSDSADLRPGSLAVILPSVEGSPLPSPHLSHWSGRVGIHDDEDALLSATLAPFRVETIAVGARDAQHVLELLEELATQSHDRLVDEQMGHGDAAVLGDARGPAHADNDGGGSASDMSATIASLAAAEHDIGPILVADSLKFFSAAARLARSLLAEQRFVPMVIQDESGGMRAAWRPWLSDDATAARVSGLLAAMPRAARAQIDDREHRGWPILTDFLGDVVDASCRSVLTDEDMSEALAGPRAKAGDPHVTWLRGLLDGTDDMPTDAALAPKMMRSVRHWIGALEERGVSSDWQLCMRLVEPLVVEEQGGGEGFDMTDEEVRWSLLFKLRSAENPAVEIEAEDIWLVRADSITLDGLRLDEPKELFLAELARAARVYAPLEEALRESEPTMLDLTTKQAYEFLREYGPLLAEQGVFVETPEWWDTPSARIGGRLSITSPDLDAAGLSATTPGAVSAARLGLNALVSYEWNLAVGDTPLTLHDFEQLAEQGQPLVRVNGRWVEVRPEDVEAAVNFLHANPGGEMKIGDALRMAFSPTTGEKGLPILGVDATGWAATLLGDMEEQSMPMLEVPEGFAGTLRPYQLKGLSWLAFLDAIGLGPCLADDMGLGKTIQLIALLLHERQAHQDATDAGLEVESIGPTLLVVPMSIVGNWLRETRKFAPSLKVLVHHGAERDTGDRFVEAATDADVVVTTYALAHRDKDIIARVSWRRVVLDEAQNIKNPAAKQSQAVHELEAPRRIVLTGTPLENRLSELWSIMDFCNPGFLGTSGEFRRAFSIPIERYRDKQRGQQLRSLVRPFILRRLKTDPTVISDLPEKLETKEFCRLTPEQATLYENTVKDMLGEVERAEGIRRRGVVLTTLIRLKQICDHPTLMLKEDDPDADALPQPSRSGKCIRLIEMLDEVLGSGEQALVFTQFRQMGHLLSAMLRHAFDRDVMFLHGGVPQGQREKLVERFQKADGSAPIFILSLKAGGVGLNLTAASHVFHFDRWWNPAVENQATDRAFRIGQKRTVNVHKYIIGGTLEERIDQMIESKVALAEDIIGSGEDWLTELTTSQLRDVLQLRPDAIEELPA